MRRMMFFLLSCLFLLFLSFPAALAETRALVVGCDRFVSLPDTTPASARNVETIAAVLSPLTPAVLNTGSPSSANELQALIAETFAGAQENDTSWFYISTHGVWNEGRPNSEMHMLLSDGQTEDGVTALQLREWFDAIPGQKILLFDCCHSGAAIGKGVTGSFENVFRGADYAVVCSSGGDEESWFWSAPDGSTGAGFFSGALSTALSGRYAADANRDGQITLKELQRCLRELHGASTTWVYPEDSERVLISCDPSPLAWPVLTGVTFENSVMEGVEPSASFSFTVLRSTRLYYQLISGNGGHWDFSAARLMQDSELAYSPDGRTEPGYKERTVWVDRETSDSSGYMLLQLLTLSDSGQTAVQASHVLCIPPQIGDPNLSVRVSESFCPESGEELAVIVSHAFPCELTVSIENENGETIRRLASQEPTRPQQLEPSGSCFYWNGLLADGTSAPAGRYRIRVKVSLGGIRYEAVSGEALLQCQNSDAPEILYLTDFE